MRIGKSIAEQTRESQNNRTSSFAEQFLKSLETGSNFEPISLYIHIPFSPARDLSCDHDTSVTHDPARIDAYLDALEKEFSLVSQATGRSKVNDLRIGGGTPNYLSDPQLLRLFTIFESHFDISDADLSLDACATRVTNSQLELLSGLGFTRIQFDVRELDPMVQGAIARSHSFSMLKDVFDTSREVGFKSVCLDLIYGLPKQTVEGIKETINQLHALSPDRIELLPWSRRPDSYQHQRSIEEGDIPSIADKVAMLATAVDCLEQFGYEWVGLDCFAKKNDRLVIAQRQGKLFRNWNGYTDKPQGWHLGFGASAVSDIGTLRVRNHKSLLDWEEALSEGCPPVQVGVNVSAEEISERKALMALMCNMRLSDSNGYYKLPDESATIEALTLQGVVERSEGHLQITPQGRLHLNQIWGDSAPQYRWGGL